VAASGRTVLVGAFSDEASTGKLAGSAYVFVRKESSAPGPDATGDGTPARDPDDDGRYEDVDGDGAVTDDDAEALFDAVLDGDPGVTGDGTAAAFDFNGDGDVTPGDATVFLDENQ